MTGNPLLVELREAITPAGTTYLVDPEGFPAERCPRCTGRGTLPRYSHNFNGVCFDCKGAGYRYPKGKSGELASDYRQRSKATPTGPAHLTTGMTVRTRGRGPGHPWRTVAAPPVTEPLQVGEHTFNAYVVTFTDGSVQRFSSESMEACPDVDALNAELADIAARARMLHERKLDRRHREQATEER